MQIGVNQNIVCSDCLCVILKGVICVCSHDQHCFRRKGVFSMISSAYGNEEILEDEKVQWGR